MAEVSIIESVNRFYYLKAIIESVIRFYYQKSVIEFCGFGICKSRFTVFRRKARKVAQMRKKMWFIIPVVIVLLVLVLLVGIFFTGILFQMDTGIYIGADSPFILFDHGSGEPVMMQSSEEKRGMFSRLRTGDRILIGHNGAMMLSYPAQINVFFCIRLKKGDISDVPKEAMDSLEEMGWLQGGTFGQSE